MVEGQGVRVWELGCRVGFGLRVDDYEFRV
jgi:hypothetical protein